MMKPRLHPDQPAFYRIQIQGYLGKHWSESMAGLTISVNRGRDQTTTTLSGEVLDQAALMGVLNGLYGMGYTLLSVEYKSISNQRS
jgi:hypothetical protein